jgi:hypothetical protein
MRSLLPHGPALFVALTLSTLAPRARADIAPPAGFVETCTLAKQSRAGLECVDCSAYHGNANHCAESLEGYGFAQSCRSRGASVWSEVWCRDAGPKASSVPKDVLAQLSNADGHPPALAATAKPAPTDPVRTDTFRTVTGTPTALPSADPPAPPITDAPVGPPPMPPTGGCGGCAMPAPEKAIWAPMLALGALALAWSRRRNRR